MTSNQQKEKMTNIFCRFYAFRRYVCALSFYYSYISSIISKYNITNYFSCRLKYNSKGLITISGFSETSDADSGDIEIWKPHSSREYDKRLSFSENYLQFDDVI